MKKHLITPQTKFSSAFSLVELLVVIAVIAVIAAIAIPNIAGVREAAETTKDDVNEKAVQRFIAQVNAVGATNTQGQAASADNVSDGSVFTTASGMTFTFVGETGAAAGGTTTTTDTTTTDTTTTDTTTPQ